MSYYVNPHDHQCPWYPYAELFGAPNIKWCEQTLCSWISEPMNTWSNVAYLIAAIYIFWRVKKNPSIENYWFAPFMFLMGLFSMIYHLSNLYITQVLDFIGMFLFTFWALNINLRRLNFISSRQYLKTLTFFVLTSTVLVHIMYLTFIKYQFLIALIALSIIITEYYCFKKEKEFLINYNFFKISLILLVIAQSASLLDVTRTICFPNSIFPQGHAIWHILSCFSLVFLYHHYALITKTLKKEI